MAKPISKEHQLFGNRIKELRTQEGITQEDLAFKTGVDRSYMGFVERGERNPILGKIIKIAKTLGVKVRDLFSF